MNVISHGWVQIISISPAELNFIWICFYLKILTSLNWPFHSNIQMRKSTLITKRVSWSCLCCTANQIACQQTKSSLQRSKHKFLWREPWERAQEISWFKAGSAPRLPLEADASLPCSKYRNSLSALNNHPTYCCIWAPFIFTEFHRMLGVGRDLCRSSSPTPLLSTTNVENRLNFFSLPQLFYILKATLLLPSLTWS